jgi:hypothetical protein
MTTEQQIDDYMAGLDPAKRTDMQALHQRVLRLRPDCKLWFLDGRNESGKVVSNPNVGYGARQVTYANGSSREFYEIGLSANTGGISVYVLGLDDKTYLSAAYGSRLGKASITGYCVKFRRLSDVDADVLEEMIAAHLGGGSSGPDAP